MIAGLISTLYVSKPYSNEGKIDTVSHLSNCVPFVAFKYPIVFVGYNLYSLYSMEWEFVSDAQA